MKNYGKCHLIFKIKQFKKLNSIKNFNFNNLLFKNGCQKKTKILLLNLIALNKKKYPKLHVRNSKKTSIKMFVKTSQKSKFQFIYVKIYVFLKKSTSLKFLKSFFKKFVIKKNFFF